MNLKTFAKSMINLCLSKNSTPSKPMILAYWEQMKDLTYLSEMFRVSMNRTYYRDFKRAMPRMPEMSELVQLESDISEINLKDRLYGSLSALFSLDEDEIDLLRLKINKEEINPPDDFRYLLVMKRLGKGFKEKYQNEIDSIKKELL